MIEIIVYSTIDGMIIKCVGCMASDVELQYGADEYWIEHGPVDDSQFKVDLNTLDIIPVE